MTKPVLTIVMIDDDQGDVRIVERLLESATNWDTKFYFFHDIDLALRTLKINSIDILLLDYNLSGVNGIEVLEKLRLVDDCHWAIIMLTGNANVETAVQVMKLGVIDLIDKSQLTADNLHKAIGSACEQLALQKNIAHQQKETYERSIKDDLTGFYNKRHFMERLTAEISRSRRYNMVLSLLMIDLDDFKLINDRWGHLVGDQVIVGSAEVIGKIIRADDLAARFGGDELMVLLPQTNLAAAQVLADRIVGSIRGKTYKVGQESFSQTCSIGVAELNSAIKTPKDLLQAADKALYQAKTSGRNQFVISKIYNRA